MCVCNSHDYYGERLNIKSVLYIIKCMWIKNFMRGINIQKYSNVFSEERVFFHVGCLSLSGSDGISEAVFKVETSQVEKAEQERKRLQNVNAPMLRVLSCVLLTGKVKLFLEVEMKKESVCVPSL